MYKLLTLALLLAAFLGKALGSSAALAAPAADLVQVKAHVVYDIRPDLGPVRVSWDITITDNDPATTRAGNGSTVSFYDTFPFPVLGKPDTLSAHSSDGSALQVTLGDPGQGPVVPATVKLDRRLFYQDSYSLSLAYQIGNARAPSLLVMPSYAYVPIIASGDEAAIDVQLPAGDPWKVSLEKAACDQSGNSFSCSGSDSVYLAALAEVSRPDATTAASAEATLQGGKTLTVGITSFQGEDAFVQHLKDLIASGLPVIEDLYGTPYFASTSVTVAERGREIILGYEGLTHCEASGCDIAVSPVAGDNTVLHELSHLWSGLYAKRWLSEGFAQLIAQEAGARLPGLVNGTTPDRPQPTVDLQLDDWGNVSAPIGPDAPQLAVENAGYYRSLRFLSLLETNLGPETLRKVNAELAKNGGHADSRVYMDTLEDISGRNNDAVFREWVFPASYDPLLAQRREARDRLTSLLDRAQAEGLSQGVPGAIEQDVLAWHFDAALAKLSDAEAGLASYDALKLRLQRLHTSAESAGLRVSDRIDKALADWDFKHAASIADDAETALASYTSARDRVDARRSLWKRFGMIGSNPGHSLDQAAADFNSGDYLRSVQHSQDAVSTVDGASGRAARRVLILAGVLGALALALLGAVWVSHIRERRLVEP